MDDPDYNPIVPPHVPQNLVYDFHVRDYNSEDPFDAASELVRKGLPEIFWTRHLGGHWCAIGVDAIKEVIAGDGTIFSADRLYVPDRHNSDPPESIPLSSDPPLHTAYRGAVGTLFTPQTVQDLEPGIRELCQELIAGIKERGECEFNADFAIHLPSTVFLRLIGLPEEDAPKLRAIRSRIENPDTTDTRNRNDPIRELGDYLRPHVEQRMKNPGDDPISHIIKHSVGDRPLDFEEVVRLTRTILLGGLGTVASQLGLIVRYLADHPEMRKQLVDNPQLSTNAVEEMLRRFPIATVMRYCPQDAVVRGVQMKAGDHIQWPIRWFNFDPSQSANPLEVRFDRPCRHASFGTRSHHFCVGAPLARLELRIFLEEWLREVPDFHVKPGAVIRYRDGGNTIGLKELPIVLGLPQ